MSSSLRKKNKKRQLVEVTLNALMYIASFIGIMVFIAILFFIFQRGNHMISWKLITGNYHNQVYNTHLPDMNPSLVFVEPEQLPEDSYFSQRFGIAFQNAKDTEGHAIVKVVYLDENSPLRELEDKNTDGKVSITVGQKIDKVIFTNQSMALSSQGSYIMALRFDDADGIRDMISIDFGGGIRGSVVTTLWIIVLTLLIGLPLGILTAIYLNEYAPDNQLTQSMRTFIDMLAGVPSIIYGLVGVALFIPVSNWVINSSGGNLLAGGMTMAVVILPIVIRTTEEALKTVPADYRSASLALGANQSQTVFKVVLPAAFPGLVSTVLLSIGRIVGESAALIYVLGTAIKDQVFIHERSTTLAVHIWSVMSGEVPNFELATAIALIILVTVLGLNIALKISTYFLLRKHRH